jgi:predicted amidohydrolase
MRTLHVAAAQIHSGGTHAQTLARIHQQAAAAAAVGVEVLLFAECALHGYDYDMTAESVRAIAEPVGGAGPHAVCTFAQSLGLTLLVGFFERDGELIYNSVLIARPDGSTATARKHALTAGEVRAALTPGGRELTIADFNGIHCAVLICADTGIEGIDADLAARGAVYRFVPTGGGGRLAEMLHEGDLCTPEGQQRYAENRPRVFNTHAILPDEGRALVGFTSANALGPAGAQTCHQGHCMIVDRLGVMRAQLPGTIVREHMQDQLIHAELAFP